MAFDFKREEKAFYMAGKQPEFVTVPKMNYAAVQGRGDPNVECGEYQQAIRTLYAVSYTIKMSNRAGHRIDGFFEYVVPPLEGFWWHDDSQGANYSDKTKFNWISVIRLPDFVRKEDFAWAVSETSRKNKADCSKAEFYAVEEGLCVQILHKGPFDNEAESIARMDAFLTENGYVNDIRGKRLHHEIYLSDARKTAPEKWRTVIRHPVRKL